MGTTTTQLAKILGISRQRVNELGRKGKIKRRDDGKWDPGDAIEARAWTKARRLEEAMKLLEGEPMVLSIQRDPLALVIANANGERMAFPLPVDAAHGMVSALLSIPEVGGDFARIAEAEVIRRIQARQIAAAN